MATVGLRGGVWRCRQCRREEDRERTTSGAPWYIGAKESGSRARVPGEHVADLKIGSGPTGAGVGFDRDALARVHDTSVEGAPDREVATRAEPKELPVRSRFSPEFHEKTGGSR